MTSIAPRLGDDAIAELLDLIRGADSVELKLTVPGGRPALDGGGARHGPARRPDPPGVLLRHARTWRSTTRGVVVRARRVQRKGEDIVVKLRPVVPAELPAELRQSPDVRRRGRCDARRLRLLRRR